MNFLSQHEALVNLDELSKLRRHSILIEGISGSGKTYLAKQYASMLNVPDFHVVEPTVSEIRQVLNDCYQVDNDVVICVENLDSGVFAASSAILKFLEEPTLNIYVVVTCRNIRQVPDTIISRSVCVTVSPPRIEDINKYSENLNSARYNVVKSKPIWKCATSFLYASKILDLTDDQLNYFDTFLNLIQDNNPVSDSLWSIGHYPDNSEVPMDLALNYIVHNTSSEHIRRNGLICMKDMDSRRIASHAVLAKFLFECKYCE